MRSQKGTAITLSNLGAVLLLEHSFLLSADTQEIERAVLLSAHPRWKLNLTSMSLALQSLQDLTIALNLGHETSGISLLRIQNDAGHSSKL